MLATAGLMLSIAALLIVIGIGEVQIAAAAGGSGGLLGNVWFDCGLFLAGVGVLWGAAAIASIGSQGKARREFPALLIEVVAGSGPSFPAAPLEGLYPTTLPPGLTTTDTWYSQMIGFRITNRELTRSASLDVRLKCVLTPGWGNETELRMRPKWQEQGAGTGHLAGALTQLRPPILLEPQSTVEGFMVFDFANVSPHLTEHRKLELVDHNCGRSVLAGTELGSVHDFT